MNLTYIAKDIGKGYEKMECDESQWVFDLEEVFQICSR